MSIKKDEMLLFALWMRYVSDERTGGIWLTYRAIDRLTLCCVEKGNGSSPLYTFPGHTAIYTPAQLGPVRINTFRPYFLFSFKNKKKRRLALLSAVGGRELHHHLLPLGFSRFDRLRNNNIKVNL